MKNRASQSAALKFEVKRYLFMVLGCFCYSMSLNLFIVPNNIVTGGVSGVAILINILFGTGVGISTILLNLPILLLGLKTQGIRFILRCFLTTAVLSFMIDTTSGVTALTQDPLMASIYGGLVQGIAIGVFCRYSVSSGGTELLARILLPIFPGVSLASMLAVVDGIVVLTGSLILGNPENVLRALIVIFLSAKVSDLIITGLDYAKMVYIITEKPNEVSRILLENSQRGVTDLVGTGMYSGVRKDVLLTVIKRTQLVQLRKLVQQADPEAFVIVSETTEVLGNGWKDLSER